MGVRMGVRLVSCLRFWVRGKGPGLGKDGRLWERKGLRLGEDGRLWEGKG